MSTIDPLVVALVLVAERDALNLDSTDPAVVEAMDRLSAVLAAAREVCRVSAEVGFDSGDGRAAPEPDEIAALRDALTAADAEVSR